MALRGRRWRCASPSSDRCAGGCRLSHFWDTGNGYQYLNFETEAIPRYYFWYTAEVPQYPTFETVVPRARGSASHQASVHPHLCSASALQLHRAPAGTGSVRTCAADMRRPVMSFPPEGG